MNNFWRAVHGTLRYRFSLLAIVFSSLIVALFWGANISAVYPVIEVVFQRKSLHTEIERRLEQSDAEFLRSLQHYAELRGQLEARPGLRPLLRAEIALQSSAILAQRQLVSAADAARPWLFRCLPDQPFPTLIFVVGFLLIGTLIKCAFLGWNMYLVAHVSQLATLELRNRFYRRTLQMELSAFDERTTGALMARFTNDMASITNGIATLWGKTLREPFKMAVCILGAAMISWRLLLLSCVVAPLCLVAMYLLARSIKRANRRAMEEMAQIYNRLAESFQAIKVVKAYTMERVERSRFLQTAKELFRRVMRITFYGSLTRTNTELLGVLVISLGLLAGGYLVLSGDTSLLNVKIAEKPFTFGSIMLFYGFLIGISDPARKLSDVFSQLQGAAAAADRVYPLLDRKPAIRNPSEPKPLPAGPQDLILEDVRFHYQPDTPVLRGVSLRIPAGKNVALVGPNGCGKSTLINLLLRFYDPCEGSIRWGLTDLREVKTRDLRKRIGLVTQQTQLFDDTIANNIRYGTPHARDQDVIAAAKRAHAHHFITERLEQGYQSQVGESGGRLSGGERQRIALARAILRDPDLLILDEATSQIDQESELLIQQAIGQFARGRTCIFITHRMSQCTAADLIVVMDRGRVAAVGPHDELLETCPLYRRLYDSDLRKSA